MDDQPCISALRPTNRDPNRITVKVDGKAVGTLAIKHIADLGLAIGQPWTDELNAELADLLLYDKAMRAATRRLARRAMSSGMISSKLRELGHGEEVRAQVIDRLRELDLLDDEAFARSLIRETVRAKPAGARLLNQKLRSKGVPPEIIERLIEENKPEPDEQHEALVAMVRKKQRSMQRLDAATRRRRLHGQLARRGFDYQTIDRALKAVEAEPDPDDY